MLSSIFNSKHGFALRVLVYFAGAFALVNMVLWAVPVKVTSKDWRDGNIARAQEFIYSREQPSFVLLGSSMSEELMPENVPGSGNLATAAYSAMTGIEILRRSGKIPAVLVIEMNTVDAPWHTGFTDKLFPPYRERLRAVFPVLRKKYQVFAAARMPLLWSSEKIKAMTKQPAGSAPAVNRPSRKERNLFQERLNFIHDRYWTKLARDETTLTRNLLRLKEHVAYYQSKSTRVVLLEVPVHEKIRGSRRARLIDKHARKMFPSSEYTWSRPGESGLVSETTDGVHLKFGTILKVREHLMSTIMKP